MSNQENKPLAEDDRNLTRAKKGTLMDKQKTNENQSDTHLYKVAIFTVLLSIISVIIFVALLASLPGQTDAPNAEIANNIKNQFFMTTAIMFVAGVIGGCLYNFRGLTKHSTDGDYLPKYTLSYFLRPISGGISGLVVFFLLLGGALALNLGGTNGNEGWKTLTGLMPYVAMSLLAGYGSHEFMLKLKDLAESLFALNNKNKG